MPRRAPRRGPSYCGNEVRSATDRLWVRGGSAGRGRPTAAAEQVPALVRPVARRLGTRRVRAGANQPSAYVWLFVLVALACTSLLYLVVPPDARAETRLAVDGASAVVALLAVFARRSVAARPWALLAGANVCSAVGDAIVLYYDRSGGPPPFPWWNDAAYLTMYPLIAAALVVTTRRLAPGRHWGYTIDAAILSTVAGLLGATYLMAPYVEETGFTAVQQAVALAYPSVDVMLVTLAVLLAVTARTRHPALLLVAAGVTIQLVTDVAFAVAAAGGWYATGSVIDVGWMLTTAVFAAAAWHPNVVAGPRPPNDPNGAGLGPGRFALLLGAALTLPLVLVSSAAQERVIALPIVAATSAVLLTLTFVRLKLAANDAARAAAERRRREDAEAAARDAAELARRQTQFATMAAHELRSPVTSLRGSIETLRDSGDRLQPAVREELLHIARRQVERLTRICGDLDVVVTTDGATLHVELGAVRLADVVHEVVTSDGGPARSRVVVDVDPDVVVTADRDRLAQVLGNLVRNAVEYAPHGVVTLTARPWRDRVAIVVADEGPGLPPAVAATPFERFGLRSPDTTGGFGVGLWIVRELVTAMGGDVGYEPGPHGGAVFRVVLPVA